MEFLDGAQWTASLAVSSSRSPALADAGASHAVQSVDNPIPNGAEKLKRGTGSALTVASGLAPGPLAPRW